MTIRRIALFGASGDLTSRLIMPALAQLAEAGLLPAGLTITGSADTVGDRRIPSYIDEPGVAPARHTETYASLTVQVDNARRNGTPFTLHSAESGRTPYANLFLEMLRGDATLFIRGDETEEAWRIIGPVAKTWADADAPMQGYRAGTLPPGPSG
ncbi:hypothetical protein [Streptomyces sp. NPDC093089]|uniref:hypothetical protein n=1 Tax=Streptomyces sp. NPDC093089 TaxID=3366024 RepID=UPI003807A627